ncbi:hypothetical protein [Marinobacter salsuginis]|uniref:hypothetical protein n=1 Tax=Marinobacter salsuginis TaxID=418719 RepID=UPI0010AA4F86|nr:hypothetical protein [Marinobacter salsuginis]
MSQSSMMTTKPLKSPRQYRALRELLAGPCSVRHLMKYAGGNNIPQLISSLRARGLEIEPVPCSGKDRDGREVRHCEYQLQPQSKHLASKLLSLEANQ